MNNKIYYAKSKRQDGSQPTALEHLDAVSALAAVCGEEVGMQEQARIAGLTHDLGKYGERFQEVLRHEAQHIDHAGSSAALLYCLWKKVNGTKRAVIEAVNGHHAGLKSFEAVDDLLKDSFRGRPYLTINDGKSPALSGPEEYNNALRYFAGDHPTEQLKVPKWNLPEGLGNLETMLYSRMLLSCLVDADYSVSAWEDDKSYFDAVEAPKLNTAECLDRLYAFCGDIRKKSEANACVNAIRDQVFAVCGECGARESGGLFTLTAPTGTGKTLALLHFALRHAKATGKRRIIIVLPFLTLAEQNAKVYEKIMPSVLVDHSQSRLGEEMREFTSKWNMPFIITTSVKFFEALFARNPADCRKLHNLAQSVVIFDEAQSLPPHLTGATLKTVNELCVRYQMTMVFSTATQPDFDSIPDLNWKPREILAEYGDYYDRLRRVKVDWRLKERVPLTTIADQMSKQNSTCAIFNLRRHAREVFDRLYENDPEAAFLISTDLCPAHRLRVVEEIHKRLADGKTCRVAATQCIEAGVDLDFDVLFRALAPLDAVVQAAGRCNRNGRVEMGQVIVFEPDDSRQYPDDWYHNAAELVKRMAMGKGIDLNDPDDIRRYYCQLFAEFRDKKELEKAICERDYEQVEQHYRLIPDEGEKLIVPYREMMEKYRYICDTIKKQGITPGLMKEAAPLTITVFDREHLKQFAEPVLFRKKRNSEDVRSGYWVLRSQYEECYTQECGFRLPDTHKSGWDMLF